MNSAETEVPTQEGESKGTVPYRLVFAHGVANLTIRVDESMQDTYRAEFYGPKPRVTEADGVISIDYSRLNPFIWGRTSASLTLSPSARWSIEIRDGVSHWDGDLRGLEVVAIEVRGGLSNADLQLPRPAGAVPIRVSGGVSHLTLRRPGEVAARIQIGGGASKLAIDTQLPGRHRRTGSAGDAGLLERERALRRRNRWRRQQGHDRPRLTGLERRSADAVPTRAGGTLSRGVGRGWLRRRSLLVARARAAGYVV